MDEKMLVGVDIGGTTIKIAFINLQGDIIKSWEIETDKRERGQHIPKTISKSIDQKLNESYQSKKRLIGIGIGAPGPVNKDDGSFPWRLIWDGRTFP